MCFWPGEFSGKLNSQHPEGGPCYGIGCWMLDQFCILLDMTFISGTAGTAYNMGSGDKRFPVCYVNCQRQGKGCWYNEEVFKTEMRENLLKNTFQQIFPHLRSGRHQFYTHFGMQVSHYSVPTYSFALPGGVSSVRSKSWSKQASRIAKNRTNLILQMRGMRRETSGYTLCSALWKVTKNASLQVKYMIDT